MRPQTHHRSPPSDGARSLPENDPTENSAMMPVRRDVRFALPADRVWNWHWAGPVTTEFMNALSLTFPAGERFFMDAVRHYRDRITDPELQRQVAGFIGQEAMHSREHVEYNDLLQAADLPAAKLDQWLWKFLGRVYRHGGPENALACTIALEHYTAMLASLVLRDPQHYVGGNEAFQHVWTWHALEEAEHKAVSYDVWLTVMKPNLGSYLRRTGIMLATTAVFWPVLTVFLVQMLWAHHRHHGPIRLRYYRSMARMLFAPRDGMFPAILKEYLDYFRPGFHPWDHDNRSEMAHLTTLFDDISESNRRYASNARKRRVPLHPDAHALP